MEQAYRWLIAIAFVLSLFSLAMTVNLSKSVADLDSKIQELSNKINNRLGDIYDSLNDIRRDIRVIRVNISDLNTSIGDLYSRISDLYNRTENLNKTLNIISSDQRVILNWLETSTREVEPYIRTLVNDPRVSQCKKGNVFDIGCFSYYLYYIYGIEHKEDLGIYGKIDILVKPTTFLREKGGDCEDFAFFYYSLLKYLKENEYSLKFPEADPSKEYILYNTGEDMYYISNAKENQIYLHNKDIYVTCWSWIIDYSKGEEGHCVIAICPSGVEIKHFTTIEQFLTWCYVIEPQYYGTRYKRYKYCTYGYCLDLLSYYNYITLDFVNKYEFRGVFMYFNDTKVCYYSQDKVWRCFQK